MKVSVVMCTYSMDRCEVFCDAIESILSQTYSQIELILVIDGNDTVYNCVNSDYDDIDNIKLHLNSKNRGISFSRTKGAELASGDIVAFIDDDGRAEPDWVEQLVSTYQETNALAVAGPVIPNWVSEEPPFFPAEFYWLVGCTERGFAEDGDEIRNGYGSNISYRRDIFLEIGGYDVNTGRKGDAHIQAHEAPVGIKLLEKYDRGMIYNEDAVVHHTLFDYRGQFTWLLFRSFWQGYSKRVMDVLYPETYGNERQFLKSLAFKYVPSRMKKAVVHRSGKQLLQLFTILVFTCSVGLGYLYGLLTPNSRLLREE